MDDSKGTLGTLEKLERFLSLLNMQQGWVGMYAHIKPLIMMTLCLHIHELIRCIDYLFHFRSVQEETARLNISPQVSPLCTPLLGFKVHSPHALTPEPEQCTLLSYYSLLQDL